MVSPYMLCALFQAHGDEAMMTMEGVTLIKEPPWRVAAFGKPRRLRLEGLGQSLPHPCLGVSGVPLNHGLGFVVCKLRSEK